MKYFINLKNIKKNGKTTVYINCHLCAKTVQINTKVETLPEKFDLITGKIKGTGKEIKDLNLILRNCESRITEIFTKYRLMNRPLTPYLLKKEYENPSSYVDFYDFLKHEIDDRFKNKELAPGTYRHHISLLNKLKVFKKTMAFSEITPDLIKQYDRFYRKKPYCNQKNTIHNDLKTWRAYLEIAVRREIITRNPFSMVLLSTEKTQRSFFEENELKEIVNIYKKGFYERYENKRATKERLKPYELKTLRHFLFMCFTGLRISDFKAIEKWQVRDNKLYYVPQKTKGTKSEEICIYLTKFAVQLIRDENSTGPLLFNSNSEQVINRQLKEIFPKFGIKKSITNHSARHTFATLFVEKTNDVASLQKLLGHSRIDQTMVYVHISKEKVLQQMKNFGKMIDC